MAQKQYKPVIILDVGKVLIDIDPNAVLEELSKRCGRKIGIPLPVDLDELFYPLYLGKRSWEDTIQIINTSLGLRMTSEEWRELWCSILKGEVKGMKQALFELKDDFRLVALSNTDKVHWTYALEKYPILNLLDGWVVSYQIGIAKPDPAIYSVAVERYCNRRLPLFYTDDVPRYIEAARQLGWDAEVFRDAAHFKEEVKKRSVKPHRIT